MADATSASVVKDALPPMKAFRQRDTAPTAFVRGRTTVPGDVVLLTEAQAASWRDLFEPVDASGFRSMTAAEAEALEKKPEPSAPAAPVPQTGTTTTTETK